MKTIDQKICLPKDLSQLEIISSGGEGTVYNWDTYHVIKILEKNDFLETTLKKIEKLISLKINIPGICFPKNFVYNESGTAVGYIMEKAQGEEMSKVFANPNQLKDHYPMWTKIDLCRIGIDLLEKLNHLHQHDILMGDVNMRNILINEKGEVYLVDTDSYQVGDIPCSVQSDMFTPRELHKMDLSVTLRSVQHECFSVAIVIFMMFITGQHPYTQINGGTTVENIQSGIFPYPFVDEDKKITPRGLWEAIWYSLSYDMRASFYRVFSYETKPFSLDYWLNTLSDYLIEMETENIPSQISTDYTSIDFFKNRSLNMNRRDISDSDNYLRIIRTDRVPHPNVAHFAVIELSTKAVKLLIGKDNQRIKEEKFDFDLFFRTSEKTETGLGLDHQNTMDLIFFQNRIIPTIKKMLSLAESHKVQIIYTVATAAYRTASNRDDIIKLISEKCRLNVKILSKKEESLATATAFLHSKPESAADKLFNSQNILMIDQGGGSTELTFIDFNGGFNLKSSYSLNLGTTVLKNIFFREADYHTTLEKALKDAQKMVKDRLRYFCNLIKDGFINDVPIDFCIAVGTAITRATGKKSNKLQHGTLLTKDYLKNKIQEADHELKRKYFHVSEIKNDIEFHPNASVRSQLDSLIVMRLGIILFIEIMEHFHIEELMVSGTGLWYGIYFQELFSTPS